MVGPVGIRATDELKTEPETPEKTPIAAAIRTIGAEHCIMSTDLGQANNPPPAEGMRIFMSALLRKGITEEEIELMTKVNPSRLLGLD